MVNDIFEKLGERNEGLVYANDAVIWKQGRNISYITRSVQRDIQAIEQWGNDWGFKFSIPKTKIMFFTRKKVPDRYTVMLYNQSIEREKKFKYLGMWLDERLTRKHHIDHIETKCKKVLNLMRMITGQCWGADKQSLMYIYKALIRSTIDYGCIVYS